MKLMQSALIFTFGAAAALASAAYLSDNHELDHLQNRQALAQKVFAERGYAVDKYQVTAQIREAWPHEYDDAYTLKKNPDDGHLYEGDLVVLADKNTYKVGTINDLGTKGTTLSGPDFMRFLP